MEPKLSGGVQSAPTSDVVACEDMRVAACIAQTRGLPPPLRFEDVQLFLSVYGYSVTNEFVWGKGPTEQPQLRIGVYGHSEFGGHTQYEIKCEVRGSNGESVTWATIRRLVHLREGLHDPVKKELQGRYEEFFGKTPFAHHAGVAGTTLRLQAWLESLATCINTGMTSPYLVASVFRLLDGPGTPIHLTVDALPISRSIFGGFGLIHNLAARPFLTDWRAIVEQTGHLPAIVDQYGMEQAMVHPSTQLVSGIPPVTPHHAWAS